MVTTIQNENPNASTLFHFVLANVTDEEVQNNIDIVVMVHQL